MQDKHVPVITLHDWLVFAAATLFGSDAGDLISEQLALWHFHVFHLPLLAVVLIAILMAENADSSRTPAWYWLAIIVIPMASNDLAASSAVYFGVNRLWVFGGLALVLVVAYLMVRSDAMHLVAMSLMERPQPAVPLTDACYWLAMVLASTLGTVAADFCMFSLDLGPGRTSLILTPLLLTMYFLSGRPETNRVLAYWMMVVVLNSCATATGRFLARDPSLGLDLPKSVVLTGTLLGLLLLVRQRPPRAGRPR